MVKRIFCLVFLLLFYSVSAFAYNIPMKYLGGDDNIKFFVRLDNVAWVELNDVDKPMALFERAMRLEIMSMT